MQDKILLATPVAFLIVLAVNAFLLCISSRLSMRPKQNEPEDAQKAYACGEEFSGHLIQPDYSQFFPFAFFFTILDVVALVIATVPVETAGAFAIALLYIIGAIIGLLILLRAK